MRAKTGDVALAARDLARQATSGAAAVVRSGRTASGAAPVGGGKSSSAEDESDRVLTNQVSENKYAAAGLNRLAAAFNASSSSGRAAPAPASSLPLPPRQSARFQGRSGSAAAAASAGIDVGSAGIDAAGVAAAVGSKRSRAQGGARRDADSVSGSIAEDDEGAASESDAGADNDDSPDYMPPGAAAAAAAPAASGAGAAASARAAKISKALGRRDVACKFRTLTDLLHPQQSSYLCHQLLSVCLSSFVLCLLSPLMLQHMAHPTVTYLR